MNAALPPQFVHTLGTLGANAAGLAEALLAGEASVSIRTNAAKGVTGRAGLEPVPWCAGGFYLPRRELFAADPQWHQGLYYVQEASSMAATAAMAELVAKARTQGQPLRVLDACAAPGGKTIGILETLGNEDFVVANESDPHRCNILLENLTKWGRPNVAVSRGDARAYGRCGEAFDIIAADVPCSGEGMMRKEAVAVQQWSPALVAQCAALQREIVTDLWRALKPGGFLLYSTCTFNTAENERNIRYMIEECGAESVELSVSAIAGVCPSVEAGIHACRFYPGRVRGEGLFLAALRKPGELRPSPQSKAPKSKELQGLSPDLILGQDLLFYGTDRLEAVPATHAAFVESLGKSVKMVRRGLPVAEIKGKNIAPTHELALSTALNLDALASLELDLEGAREYLRGNALTDLPSGLQRGYFATLYRGRPLGLAKCVGNRANNLYPNELRLRLGTEALCAPVAELLQPLQAI